ncbi:hypothetical protein BHE90_013265 [Fusarium euwallaceae]|uniref:Uncharacterized protein n=1 Tax=Fusarium euwallaceae TaxID=1147111 RepID=A0A430L9A5_9HYPO|nr:hypothetical protein BHE90_013265 [Fusarium euwallaceae]
MRRDCTPPAALPRFPHPRDSRGQVGQGALSGIGRQASTASEDHHCKHELGHEALNYGGQQREQKEQSTSTHEVPK